MRLLFATDVALALAIEADALIVREHQGRFGPYVSLEDAFGLIEVHHTRADADARIAAVTAAISKGGRAAA